MPVAAARVLTPAEFFHALRLKTAQRLPPDLRSFQCRRMGRLMKFHYGRTDIHFETWHHLRSGRLEVGLHFESRPDLNQAAFEFFRARMVAVKASLPKAELEPWDRGWTRLYETIRAPDLDSDVLDTAAALLAAYLTALGPLVEEFLEAAERY